MTAKIKKHMTDRYPVYIFIIAALIGIFLYLYPRTVFSIPLL